MASGNPPFVSILSNGERERERERFWLLLFVWYTRDNVAINIFYRRTCVGRVFATCPPYTVVPGGTTPIGGAIKPSIDGLKGKLAYGHGQRSILLFFFFFFLYKEISREMKENDSSSLRG